MKKYILILVGVIIVSFGVGTVILLTTNEFNIQEHEINQVVEYDTVIDYISVLQINAVSENINFFNNEDNEKLIIEYLGTEKNISEQATYELKTELENGILEIDIERQGMYFDIYPSYLELNIYLPKYFEPVIKAETVSGYVYSELAYADVNYSFKTVSGKIEVDNFAGEINAETTSGDINLNYLLVRGDLKIDTVSGDVNIIIPSSEYLTAMVNTVSGKIDKYFSENNFSEPWYARDDDFITTVSGDIAVEENDLLSEDGMITFENTRKGYRFDYDYYELSRVINRGDDLFDDVVFSNLYKESYSDIDPGEFIIMVRESFVNNREISSDEYKKYLNEKGYVTYNFLEEHEDRVVFEEYNEGYYYSYMVAYILENNVFEVSIQTSSREEFELNKVYFDQVVNSFELL